VKIHFYQIRPGTDRGEYVRDFLYSTGFSIAAPTNECGLFNYNANDGLSIKRLPNIRAFIKINNMTVVESPSCRRLRIKGPNSQHHDLVVEVGDWLDVTFCEIWPKMRTTLSNPRTYFRDYGCTFFFTDICKLFDKQGESHLPGWLGCYSLANALVVNQTMSVSELLECLQDDGIKKGKVQEVMRIVKCVLTPWTMCVREGLYWEDKCIGEPVEDQPFPLSFVPTSKGRVFGKDDCEGRASQAQEMRELLECIFKHATTHGVDHTYEQMMQSGVCGRKLRMQEQTRRQLLEACVHIGRLLHTKVLEVQTIVGDANVTALSHAKGPDVVVGHSFGLMLYKNGQEYMMVENTGWQRRFLKGIDQAFTGAEKAFIGAFTKAERCGGQIAGVVTKAMEQKIYQTLYFGHDRIYFSKNTKRYGATLDEINAQQCKTMSIAQVLTELSKTPNCFGCPPKLQAVALLKKYQQAQANLADIRRVIMPPQKSEAGFEALMESWGEIYEDSMSRRRSGGIWFTIDRDVWGDQKEMVEQLCLEGELSMTTHLFIHSVVVCVGH
jgi:hypothetical protein